MKNSTKFILLLLVIALAFTLLSCGGNKDTDTADTTATATDNAVTSEETTVIKYKVTYDGTNMPVSEVVAGESVAKPADPEKDNMIFGGWFTDSAHTKEATFPITVNSDITLYADFYSLKTAMVEARNKTVGDDVGGFEYSYTNSLNVTFAGLSLNGNTVGKAQYSKTGDVSFYDEHTNSGSLFYDGSKYQIRKSDELQKISLNEENEIIGYSTEKVAADYKFDSSSFAKALFEFDESKLKSVTPTGVANEYQLDTSFTASDAISVLGNNLNNPAVEQYTGTLPATAVNTAIYVTFANGRIESYRYEMHVDVEALKLDLVYKLTFSNVGKEITITPKSFDNLYIDESSIAKAKNEILTLISDYKKLEKSGYDFKINTGVDFGASTSEINATFDGSTLRKVDGNSVYFHNDIEIDSDFKNSDLYKNTGLDDIHIKKTMLSNGEVHVIEKKLLKDATYQVENYQQSENDSFFMLDLMNCINNITFIEKAQNEDSGETVYSIGISSADIADILTWMNNSLNLYPIPGSESSVKVYGTFNASTVKADEVELLVTAENGKLKSVKLEADGEYTVAFDGSAEFTQSKSAEFEIDYKIEVNDKANDYEPFETVKAAK